MFAPHYLHTYSVFQPATEAGRGAAHFALLSLLHFESDGASQEERGIVAPQKAQGTLNVEGECEREQR